MFPSVQRIILSAELQHQSSPFLIALHCSFVPWYVIDVRDLQPQKALYSIFLTLIGILIETKDEQCAKAQSPIPLTLLGITIDIRPTCP